MSNNGKVSLQHFVELTKISKDATNKDIKKLCKDAVTFGCRSVCVNPEWVHFARTKLESLGNSNIKVVQVYDFPTSSSKIIEGDEVDVFIGNVQRISESKAAQKEAYEYVEAKLQEIEKAGVDRKNIKFVIETRILSIEDIKAITRVLCKAKVGYVKSSTGLFQRRNNRTNLGDLEAIKDGMKVLGIERRKLGLYQPKIKISGGIREVKQAWEILSEGADLLGTSSVLIPPMN